MRGREQIKQLNDGRDHEADSNVNYGEGTVETLFKITRIVRNVGLVLVVGLAFTAMFLISNTIKLTIFARRTGNFDYEIGRGDQRTLFAGRFLSKALCSANRLDHPDRVLLFGYASLVDASRFNLGLMLIQLVPLEELAVVVSGILLGNRPCHRNLGQSDFCP